MADVELLPLPDWGGAQVIPDDLIRDYARANVAAKDAEIEALRAELAEARDGWHMANGTADLAMKHRDAAEARAERLAEALREMIELREATQRGEVHPTRHELDIVKDARALLREQEEGNG